MMRKQCHGQPRRNQKRFLKVKLRVRKQRLRAELSFAGAGERLRMGESFLSAKFSMGSNVTV